MCLAREFRGFNHSSLGIVDAGSNSVAGFTEPPLERTAFSKGRSFFSFLWEGRVKVKFHKASPYQRSLKLKEGANVVMFFKFIKHSLKDTSLNLR